MNMKIPFTNTNIVFNRSSSNFTNGRAGTTKRKTYVGNPKPVDKDLTPRIRQEQIENSRGLERNSGLVAQIVSDFRTYSVPEKGFRPDIQTADADFNRDSKAYFENWARNASICGRFNLTELCMQIAGTIPIDGEIFSRKTRVGDRPVIQLIESHDISTFTSQKENVIDGVKLGPGRKPLKYAGLKADGSTQWLKASAVDHIFNPYRPSSVRYSPFIQHSIDTILDEQEVIGSEINVVKDNQKVSLKLFTKEKGQLEDDAFNFDGKVKPTGENGETTAKDIAKATNARVIELDETQDLKEHESARPSPTFIGLLEHLQRDALAGILPYEFAVNPNAAKGGAIRLVVGKANRVFSWHSRIIINRFLNKVWFFVIGDAIDRGLLPPVPGWHLVQFSTPKKLSTDFGRDEAQNRLNVESGLKGYDEDYEERGLNGAEEMEKRAKWARNVLRLQGHEDWENMIIPEWMLLKPTGTSLSTELDSALQNQDEQ